MSAGGGVGGGSPITPGTPVEGVDIDLTTTPNVATVSISSSTGNCSKTNNYSTPVTVAATIAADDATGAGQVIPNIVRAAANAAGLRVAATLSFTVVCPAASANMGQELVPENPFPISE